MGCLCSKSAKPSIDRALEPRELPGSNVIGCIVELCSNETGGHEVYRTFNGQRYRKIEGRVVKSIYADGAQPQTVPVKLSPNVPTFLVDSAVSLVQSSMEREAQLTMSDDRSFKLQIGRACKGDVMARLSKEGVSAGGGGEVERALRLETRGGEGTVNFELLVPTVELEFRSGLQLGEVGVAPQQRHPTLLPKYIHRVVLGVRAEASITIEQGRREESKEAEAGAGARFTVAEDAIMVGVQCSAGSDTIRHEGPIAKSVSSRGSFRLDTANIVNQSLSHSMDAIEEQAEQAVYQPDQWRVLFVGVRRSSHTEEELEQQCRQAGEELLTLLEDNPDRELDVAVPEHIRRTVTDARRAIQGGARSMLVVGDTDSGKSSLCGLLNGSLHFDEELKIWRSDFAIGNGADALTNNTELRVCSWLGNDGTHNTQEGGDGTQKRTKIVLLDSPGLGDSRGAEVDRQHMDEVAQIVIGVERIHTITVVLKNDDTQTARMISPHLREALAYLQDIFGTAMWDHVVVIVNRWRHDTIMKERRRKRKEQTEEDFSRNFRSMLMQPAPRQAALTGEDGHIGLGLTGEQTSRIRFFFMDTQYERSDAGEAFSMGSELDQLRCHLVTMGLWKAKVTRPCSAQLRDLIFAVQYRSDAASLQEALDAAEAARPQLPDLSREKLDAIRKEIKRRSGIDRVRTLMANGLNAVKNAWDKWQAFSRIHTNCLEPQDAAMQFLLAMSTVTMVFEEVDTEGLTHEFDQRQVAGRPINHVKKELEDSRRLVVNAMNRGEEPTDLRDEELAQSFQVLVHHGKRNKKLEEFIRGVLEEAAIASAGTILRNACQWAEAGGVQTRAEILRRIDDFSKAAGLRDVELERLRTLLEVTQTLEMKAAGDIPLDQLKIFHNRAVEAEMGSLIRRLALMIQTQEEELEREAKLAAERRMAEVAEQEERAAAEEARLRKEEERRNEAQERERRRREEQAELERKQQEDRRLAQEAEAKRIRAEQETLELQYKLEVEKAAEARRHEHEQEERARQHEERIRQQMAQHQWQQQEEAATMRWRREQEDQEMRWRQQQEFEAERAWHLECEMRLKQTQLEQSELLQREEAQRRAAEQQERDRANEERAAEEERERDHRRLALAHAEAQRLQLENEKKKLLLQQEAADAKRRAEDDKRKADAQENERLRLKNEADAQRRADELKQAELRLRQEALDQERQRMEQQERLEAQRRREQEQQARLEAERRRREEQAETTTAQPIGRTSYFTWQGRIFTNRADLDAAMSYQSGHSTTGYANAPALFMPATTVPYASGPPGAFMPADLHGYHGQRYGVTSLAPPAGSMPSAVTGFQAAFANPPPTPQAAPQAGWAAGRGRQNGHGAPNRSNFS